MTSPDDQRTRKGGSPDSGRLVRKYFGWALFGAFGIGVAVGIALVAGQLASQPVGITGEPVAATESLASPPERSATRPYGADRKEKRDGQAQEAAPETAPGTVGTAPSGSSSGSAYSGNPGSSAGNGGSGSSVSGSSGSSSSENDYDDGEGSDYEYGDDSNEDGDDSNEDGDDDYEDDD